MLPIAEMARRVQLECLCTRVRQVARTMSKLYDDTLRPLGLQSSQYTLLVTVQRFGERGAPISGLARQMRTDRTTLSRNLRPLERSGHLRVARSPSDARVKLVLLTRLGEEALATAFPLWEAAQKKVRARLGAAKSDKLADELDRVEELLSGS